MKQNYKLYLCALLLVGAVNTMTIGALGADKPTLAVFVVGMDNTLGNALATQMGSNLTSGGQYALTSVNTSGKRDELRVTYASGGGSSIDRSALAAWGRANGISAICLVVDDVKGSDHMFYAQLIDAKDSKVLSRGNYVRTGVGSGELPRVSSALAQQLNGPERRRSTPTPTRAYPAELDIEMVFVTGGTFQVGCNGGTDAPCNGDNRETPQRTVTVSSFSIGKYEITRAQWIAAMKGHPTLSNPGNWKDDDQLPIETVKWNEVDTAFLPRLNALTGKQYRLPTSTEWEYAARGCKAGQCDAYKYSGSNDLGEVGWCLSNSSSRTHPVGQKKPNGLGIYDMSGNVEEWCSDWYDANYYKNTLTDGTVNPKGPDNGANRIVRGGNYGDAITGFYPRVASRHSRGFTLANSYTGFRVVLPAQ
ncbi:MAG: formylglycine-generating enzyme family protein [Prevotellaceae bacterium]|jgi:formylglycine-generating enzyme required for sulfatase activity|nr:formylglycine-generating enzyme family protein [Prevotellaceae bacterium]